MHMRRVHGNPDEQQQQQPQQQQQQRWHDAAAEEQQQQQQPDHTDTTDRSHIVGHVNEDGSIRPVVAATSTSKNNTNAEEEDAEEESAEMTAASALKELSRCKEIPIVPATEAE